MTITEKRKVLAQLQFIHQRLSQTSQYFIEEFEIARDALALVTGQFNALQDEVNKQQAEIDATEKAPEVISEKAPEVISEQAQ